MVQIVFSQDSYSKRSPRESLTEQEEWALVAQVKERTQLLKQKKKGLTLAEKRVCIQGERALGLLVEECHPVILAQIHSSKFSHRIPVEDMYQIGLTCVELAANSHNPSKPGRKKSFKNWVSLNLRSRLINRFVAEFRHHRRGKAYCDQLIGDDCTSDSHTPLESACKTDLRVNLERIINDSLPDEEAKLIHEYYFQGKESKYIAASLGIRPRTVMAHIGQSRKQLRDNPQLRELAESVFSAASGY